MISQSIDFNASTELRHDLASWRRKALIVAAIGLGASTIGAFVSTDQFFKSYLWSYMFIVGLSMGSLAWLMLQYLTGGAWGMVIRRPAEAAIRLVPALAVLFIPIVIGAHSIYEWTHPAEVAKNHILQHRSTYLNLPFFIARAAVYFAGWFFLSWLLNRKSAEQDRTSLPADQLGTTKIAAPGLIFWSFSVTFMAIDWVMSTNPHWFSTMYGLLFMAGQALTSMAFLITALVLMSGRRPYSEILTPRHLHDLGKFTLAFVMVWAYFSFSQFLIIWAGNLPEEIPWYLTRMRGGWGVLALLLVIGHFALPFALLLSRDLKRNFKLLSRICVFILFMRLVDLFWVSAPDMHHGHFTLSWLDFTLPIGLIGLWLYLFFAQLGKHPLMPIGDPELEETLHHGRE